jgi:hypothetical protein
LSIPGNTRISWESHRLPESPLNPTSSANQKLLSIQHQSKTQRKTFDKENARGSQAETAMEKGETSRASLSLYSWELFRFPFVQLRVMQLEGSASTVREKQPENAVARVFSLTSLSLLHHLVMKTHLHEGNLEIYSKISFGGRGAKGGKKKPLEERNREFEQKQQTNARTWNGNERENV